MTHCYIIVQPNPWQRPDVTAFNSPAENPTTHPFLVDAWLHEIIYGLTPTFDPPYPSGLNTVSVQPFSHRL